MDAMPVLSSNAISEPLEKLKRAVSWAEEETVKVYTLEEVKGHKDEDDLWIIVFDEVYDVTRFANEHPGGKKLLLGVAGRNATKKFQKYHRDAILARFRPELVIGRLDTSRKQEEKRSLFDRFLKPRAL